MNQIAIVGYNLFASEWHPGRRILSEALKERGLREATLDFVSVDGNTKSKLAELKPSVTVALGDSALRLLVDDKPPNVLQSRGYLFETELGVVLATVDPANVHKNWTPWRVLLSMDLQRAKDINKNGFQRPVRNVEVLL